MKKVFILPCTLLLVSIFFLLKAEKDSNLNSAQSVFTTQGGYTNAIRISQSQFNDLTSSYALSGSNTQGGMFSKSDLMAMIDGMASGDDYVDFRFGTDRSGMVSLMLMGGKKWYQGSSKIDCFRNGGNAAAFCPSNCMSNSEGSATIDITYAEYMSMASAYQTANPDKTWGGNIDKDALTELLNSIPDNVSNVSFMFCKDPDFGKTSVIFVGGKVNQANDPLMFRNGITADAFCPTMCIARD